MDEFNLVKARYSELIFPKMAPHQQVMLGPGVFGCANATVGGKPFSLEEQGARIVKKLDAFFGWAKVEPRIAGFWPYGFLTPPPPHPKHSTATPPPCASVSELCG